MTKARTVALHVISGTLGSIVVGVAFYGLHVFNVQMTAFQFVSFGGAISLLLALATALGRLSPEEAWEAAHVDEDWQISQWGEDEEARERRENRRRDFAAAARMVELLRA